MRNRCPSSATRALFVLLASNVAVAQELPPPQVPIENPLTTSKVNLGKALFWDEQLSVTNTVACGTCHRPSNAGADPRAAAGGPGTTHPGANGQLGDADDIVGSAGVPL
ncbi:MAG: hypothetical protein HC888_17805, partial [Candidatus Competibacteraceae bacterium]|nr:hypothetical protein [Candidatus Competibacteraceae bacterium]